VTIGFGGPAAERLFVDAPIAIAVRAYVDCASIASPTGARPIHVREGRGTNWSAGPPFPNAHYIALQTAEESATCGMLEAVESPSAK